MFLVNKEIRKIPIFHRVFSRKAFNQSIGELYWTIEVPEGFDRSFCHINRYK